MENAIAVRSEDHGLSIRRPRIRKVSSLIETETLERAQPAAPRFDLGYVDGRGFRRTEKAQPFAVCGNTGAPFSIGAAGEADGLTPSLIAAGIDVDGPKIGVVLVGREFAKGINQASIGRPGQGGSEAAVGEHVVGLAAEEIMDAERDIGFFPTLAIDRPQEGNAMPIWGPNDGLATVAWLAQDFARVLAIGLHLPDFFMTVVAADKNNLRTIGRDSAAFGSFHEFAGCATEDRDAPQAGLLCG